jgi:TrmH family RNA methyltransferase
VKPLTVARDLRRRRARERTGLFLAEGIRCVEELLASSLEIRTVVVSPSLGETDRGAKLAVALRSTATARGFDVQDASDRDLAENAETDTPQGILAIARIPERSFENVDMLGVLLMLDAIQDPGNVGTILRTAHAFGVAATIALPGTVDLWNPKVVRAAMGALFTHGAFHSDVPRALQFVRDGGMRLWATSATGESIARHDRGAGGVAIVVGNEGSGVSPDMVAAADRTVAIPVRGVESLNVAVATGILLYAVTTE